VFEAADKNGDKTIDYEEFVDNLKPRIKTEVRISHRPGTNKSFSV